METTAPKKREKEGGREEKAEMEGEKESMTGEEQGERERERERYGFRRCNGNREIEKKSSS